MKEYDGINIQWPISELIASGKKTIETRTYPIPNKYLDKHILLIETPGKEGKFKARITAIIKFTECFLYKNKTTFYKDYKKHHVAKESPWAWTDKPKYGWEVEVIKVFSSPKKLSKRNGIRFTNSLTI